MTFVDQLFTHKKSGKRAREKKRKEYVGFMDLEKAREKINRRLFGRY